jgi:hypothetical protein
VLDLFLVGQRFQLLVETFGVIQKDDESAHVALAVLGGAAVDYLDELGEGFADLKGNESAAPSKAANKATMNAGGPPEIAISS